MNPKFFFLTALSVVIFSFSTHSSISKTNAGIFRSANVNLISEINSIEELTYVKTYADGMWWIYVYDGSEFVDRYP